MSDLEGNTNVIGVCLNWKVLMKLDVMCTEHHAFQSDLSQHFHILLTPCKQSYRYSLYFFSLYCVLVIF